MRDGAIRQGILLPFRPEAEQLYAQQFARIDSLELLLQLVDQALTLPTTAAFDQALLAYLPAGDR